MKIALVSKYFHPHVGGVESQTRLVAHHLSRRHDVEVASMRFGKRQTGFTDDSVRIHRVAPKISEQVRSIPSLAAELLASGGDYERARAVAYSYALQPIVRGKDVVHSVNRGAFGWAAEYAARREGVPFVMTPYAHPGEGGDKAKRVELYKRAEVVFALLETDRDHLVELGIPREKIRISGVVPLLPDAMHPLEFRQRHDLGNSHVVLFIGRMNPRKGYQAILDAAPLVWNHAADVFFLFAGPGDRDEVQALSKHNDDRVRYLGLVSDQEKGDALAACDLFCMPSISEILPAVYLEAWSCGKPVIGGTAHGLAQLIEGNSAGFISDHHPETLAQKIIQILGDDSLRHEMGENGRKLVAHRFSEERLVRVYESAYEQVRGHRPSETA